MHLKDEAGNFTALKRRARFAPEEQNFTPRGGGGHPQMLNVDPQHLAPTTAECRSGYIISATGSGAAFNSICKAELYDWARIRLGAG